MAIANGSMPYVFGSQLNMATNNMSPGPAEPVSDFTEGGQYKFTKVKVPGSTMFEVYATDVTPDANGKVAQSQPFPIAEGNNMPAMRFSTDQEAIAHIMKERNKMNMPFNKGRTITFNQEE